MTALDQDHPRLAFSASWREKKWMVLAKPQRAPRKDVGFWFDNEDNFLAFLAILAREKGLALAGAKPAKKGIWE
jgi:hypothetical protein